MKDNIADIMEVCLLAGNIMLTNGGETYRVEDTMIRIAKAYSVRQAYSFVTPTGIFLSLQGKDKNQEQTRFIRISERSIDLNKIALVNEISRKISDGLLTIDEAHRQLLTVEQDKPLYPRWLQSIAASIASGFFTLMFGGAWEDFLPAFIAGGAGFIIFFYGHRLIKVKFFAEIFASFIIGALSYLFLMIGLGVHLDKIMIGSVMPLVPGVLITNAVRDLMAGDLVSGLVRGAEAFFTALAIGTGIAVIIALL